MKIKKFLGLGLAALAVLAFAVIHSMKGQNPPQLYSVSAVDLLTGDAFCLRYTSQWIFADGQPAEFVEIKDGPLRLQKYNNYDGSTVVTLTENGVSKVLVDGELLQEIQAPEASGETSVEMRYNGKKGSVALEENDLSFEEYSCGYNGTDFTLRFLFLDEDLWGIQYGDDGRYVKILELTGDMPEEYRNLYNL